MTIRCATKVSWERSLFNDGLWRCLVAYCNVIIMRHKRGKGNRRLPLPLTVFWKRPLLHQLNAGKMMHINRLSVLSKFGKFGDTSLVWKLRNAGKYTTQLHRRRTFQTHSRNLAYAKDLFLGQLNKVNDLWCKYLAKSFLTVYYGITSLFVSVKKKCTFCLVKASSQSLIICPQ